MIGWTGVVKDLHLAPPIKMEGSETIHNCMIGILSYLKKCFHDFDFNM